MNKILSCLKGDMRKLMNGLFCKAHTPLPKRLKKTLREKNACYVLITCKEPGEDGKMEVELTYEGDECLAAYLIESAQGFIDERLEDECVK